MLFSCVEASEKRSSESSQGERKHPQSVRRLETDAKKSFTGTNDSLYGLLKKKHSNETSFFDQFYKPHWNGMYDY